MNNLEIQKEQQSENNEDCELEEDSDSLQNRLLLNNIPTPSRTESDFQTSINKTRQTQSIQQLNNHHQYEQPSHDQDTHLTDLDLKKQTQMSYNSSKSSKTQTPLKINLLQASLIAKDQLILNLQEEVKQLKKQQIDKDKQMAELSRNYEIKLQQMSDRITDLEKIIKEKDHDIEQFKNGNNTLNLQDSSVLTNIQNDPKKLKPNEFQTNELQAYRQNADLYLNSNFWLISAERKLWGNNPTCNYQAKDNFDGKQSQLVSQQQRGIDKPYQIRQSIQSMNQIKYNANMQLPKLGEGSSQINLQQQKYYHTNVRSQSLQQNNQKSNSSLSQLYNNKDAISYDPDGLFAGQEIKQIFTNQTPLKMESLDWNSQPSNKYMITYNHNLNQSKFDIIDKAQKQQNLINSRKHNSQKIFNKQ
ncbi:unnamed protein product (macronuclear) [Paramecium tetraurelia]|uniref:Uncharacterized protein n=1 Tax=Paramecium tetraurelia TaxID=5888 RepID=A0E047_PARTE|nr:uncharacterized protein GSPATT00021832001 [Paramecium tetraurelia]CAK88664.1 unnamed protein product [Paramecium tetraurelia]|eukprot:XP_001456061.1 hypothetical protein (macronuclear) [Paramecium tetraurelia strain d4-2]